MKKLCQNIMALVFGLSICGLAMANSTYTINVINNSLDNFHWVLNPKVFSSTTKCNISIAPMDFGQTLSAKARETITLNCDTDDTPGINFMNADTSIIYDPEHFAVPFNSTNDNTAIQVTLGSSTLTIG